MYLRTYSRFIPELSRRENWDETVDRVVRYSASLAPDVSATEQDELRQTIFNLLGFPAGRTLWVGGTDFTVANGQSQYNCAFMIVEEPKDFYDMILLLMSGTGVGFRVTDKKVKQFNQQHPIRRELQLQILPYQFIGYDHAEYTEETKLDVVDDTVHLTVGDSRTAWAKAVMIIVMLYTSPAFDNVQKVVVNLNSLRPQGHRLRTFGGYASGPEPLVEFFVAAKQVIERAPERKWTSTKLLDLMNLIGRATVAGGSRRSAQIAIGSPDDDEFTQAKTGTWWGTAPWRTQSNNSVLFDRRPDKKELLKLLNMALEYGEPGFINQEAALKRYPNFKGLNPCAEQLLDNHGVCNLATIVLPRHLKPDGELDWPVLKRTIRLLVRHAMRITQVRFHPDLLEWQAVQDRDRLVGISFTGFGDLVDQTGMSESDQQRLLKSMQNEAMLEAYRYSTELGIPMPKTLTSVKPEGTLSLLPGVSSGVHAPFAPYYIRRVRISKSDAVAQALVNLGMQPKPEVGFASLEEAHTWVFEFPVKTPAKRSAASYSAVEQLERYKMVMNYWADANVSITVYVNPNEKQEVVDWLYQNWDNYVAVSFLPKNDTVYPLMPLEEITEAQYEAMQKAMPSNLNLLKLELDRLEAQLGSTASDELDPSCATGACPVR